MDSIYESFNLSLCLIGLIIGVTLPCITVNFLGCQGIMDTVWEAGVAYEKLK